MQVTALSSISRKTLADGQWITENIIKVADDDLQAIATDLGDLDKFGDLRNSAIYGQAAWDKVKDYDLAVISANTSAGKQALDKVATFDYDKVVASAKSGVAAAGQILPYDIAQIEKNAKSGMAAWNAVKDYDFPTLQANAKDARAGYNLLSAYAPTINGITSTYANITAITAQGTAASAAIKTGRPSWDSLKQTIDASAGQWNKLSSYYNTTKSGYLDRSYNWVSANSGKIGTLEQNLGNTAKWNSTYNTVCADSGISAWNRAYSGVMSSYGWEEWNKLPGETSTFNKLSAVSANSSRWNTLVSMVNASADKFTNTFTGVTANRDKWITYNKLYNPYVKFFTEYPQTAAKWNNAFFAPNSGLSAKSGYWDTITKSANTYSSDWNKITGYKYDIEKWKAAYFAVNNTSSYWEQAYKPVPYMKEAMHVFSSHSGTQTTPMWDMMAYGKSDWWGKIGSFTGMWSNSANIQKQLDAYNKEIRTGNGAPFSACLSAATGKSYTWKQTGVKNNYDAWYKLWSYDGGFANALNSAYNNMKSTSGKWVQRNTNSSLKILRRKGAFTKKFSLDNVAATIFMMS